MRTLLTVSLSFAAAVFGALYTEDLRLLAAVAGALILAGLALLWLRTEIGHRGRLVLFAAALGVAWTAGYTALIARPARSLDGQTRTLTVVTLDYAQASENYCRVQAELQETGFPRPKLWLYDSSYTLADTKPGQKITAQMRLRYSGMRYGREDETYPASGFFLLATAQGEITFGEQSSSLRFLPVRLRKAVTEQIRSAFSGRVRTFMTALMLGEKSSLYADTSLNTSLSKAGLMHVVAVSGMHVSFLVTLITLLFGNTRRSAGISLVLIWLFVLMTGASPSAFRAGFMQSVLLLAPFVKRENDPPTALGFALLVLLLGNPFSIRSVSLQMSFAAMAGLLCFAGRIFEAMHRQLGKRMRHALVRYFAGILSCSLGVLVFTVPLTALYFGSVQILAPVVSLAVLWAVSFCFCGGYAAVGAAAILPVLGRSIAVPVSLLAEYILTVAKTIASVPFCSVYTCSDAVVGWVIATYVLFLIFLRLRKLHALRFWIPAGLSALSLVLLLIGTKYWYRSRAGVYTVLNVGQGQCITAFSGDQTLVIDCGNTMAETDAGQTAGEYLRSCGRERVDLLVLTHLHEDHVNGVETLLCYIPVREIVISEAAAANEVWLRKIRTLAAENDVLLTEIRSESEATLGNITLHLYPPQSGVETDDENERCTFMLLSDGDYDMLVTGDANSEAEIAFLSAHTLPEIDLLVAGHHGSRTSSSQELLSACRGASAVISTGYNTYGHPHEETLARLGSSMCAVYRTDEQGTLEFIVPDT